MEHHIFLIKTTADKSGFIMKDLLFKASELGVMIRFTPVSEERYDAWVKRQGRNRYIVTLLGRKVTAQHIANVTQAVYEEGLNIDSIRRLTGRMPLNEDDRAQKSCIELSVRGNLKDRHQSLQTLRDWQIAGDILHNRDIQTLEQRHTLGEALAEIYLTAHGSLGDCGNLITHSGTLRKLVNNLSFDKRRVHIETYQATRTAVNIILLQRDIQSRAGHIHKSFLKQAAILKITSH